MKNAVLFETDYWKVILADSQYCLGRCAIDAKRDVGALRNLTKEEWKDFEENIVKKLEKLFTKQFGAEMFNWSCYMNNAYKPHIKKPHPHIHWHFTPRYRNPIEFAGETFHDEKFGHNPMRCPERRVSQELFDEIKKEIIKGFS